MKVFFLSIGIFLLCSFSLENKTESELILDVVDIPCVQGKISILVFNKEEGFPEKKENAVLQTTVEVVAKTMKINLGKLPHGNYAIAIIHDKNANQELDKNLIGLPKEAFGFSNTFQLTFGPPSFFDATIQLNSENNSTTIKLIEI